MAQMPLIDKGRQRDFFVSIMIRNAAGMGTMMHFDASGKHVGTLKHEGLLWAQEDVG